MGIGFNWGAALDQLLPGKKKKKVPAGQPLPGNTGRTPYKVPATPPAGSWMDQYNKAAAKGTPIVIKGNPSKLGGGLTTGFRVPTVLKPGPAPVTLPPQAKPAAAKTVSTKTYATPGTSPPVSAMPTGLPSAGASAVNTTPAFDVASLLAMLSVPGDNRQLNVQAPVLQDIDLKPIYDKYAPVQNTAYDQLVATLGGIRTGAEQSMAGYRTGTQDAFGRVNTDAAAESARNKQNLLDTMNRLGLQESAASPELTKIDTDAARLKGLTDLTQTTRLNTQQGLDQARLGNFDTIGQMAAGSKTKALQDLIDTVSGGEIQGKLNNQTAMAEIQKMIAGGKIDFAKLIQEQRNAQLGQNLSVFNTLSDQYSRMEAAKAAAAKTAAENDPLTGTETMTNENEDFWNSLNKVTGSNPTAAALWDTSYKKSGMSIPDTATLLSTLSAGAGGKQAINDPYPVASNSFTSPGGFVNTGQSSPEADAAKLLLEAYSNYGGYGGAPVKKTTTTLKKGSNG